MATNNSLESEKNYSATAEKNELENGGFNLRMLLDIVLGNWFGYSCPSYSLAQQDGTI